MREFGQLGVVAKKHHALQLVAELVNDDEQVIRLAGIQPIIYHDILELVIELLGDDLRRRERASPDSTGSNRAAHRASPIAYPSSAHRSGPRCARAARVAGAPDRAVRRRARTLAAGRTAARAAHVAQGCPAHSARPAWPSSWVISCTGTGLDCQISAQYSRIVRSEENLPERAVFRIDMRVQRSLSRKAASTCCWQSAYAL